MSDDTETYSLSKAVIPLLKGVAYREAGETQWQELLALQTQVRGYVSVMGLELVIDEAEGYAFLKSREYHEDEEALPRLISRRPLSYRVSLLLALLRKRLVEFDATGGSTRLILDQEELFRMMSVFLPPGSNEVRRRDKVESDVEKVVKLGFLRKLRGQDDHYEVRRVIKAFVDAQWLSNLEQSMASQELGEEEENSDGYP